jgi:hypothetical protein
MKKTLLTLALVALTTVASYAQGTIAFGNGTLTRVTVRNLDGSSRGNATAQDNLIIGVFFGAEGASRDALQQAPGTATIGTTAGVMINAPSVFQLPGTEPGQVVSLQIRAWNEAGTLAGETGIISTFQLGPTGERLGLGPTAGPGYVIWQTAASTNPQRFTPLVVNVVPEPSTIALAVLGLGSLLLFRRRK